VHYYNINPNYNLTLTRVQYSTAKGFVNFNTETLINRFKHHYILKLLSWYTDVICVQFNLCFGLIHFYSLLSIIYYYRVHRNHIAYLQIISRKKEIQKTYTYCTTVICSIDHSMHIANIIRQQTHKVKSVQSCYGLHEYINCQLVILFCII